MKYEGVVIRGRGRGERMNLPTLNFAIPKGFPFPYGIYAGTVYAEGSWYRAAFHYGPVPTFNTPQPSLEAFVLQGIIPIQAPLMFELIRYIRPIKKFPSALSLRSRIDTDIAVTVATFQNNNAGR